MPMNVGFQPDQGFRLSQSGVSILLHVLAQSRPGLSGPQQQDFFRIIQEYLHAVGTYETGALNPQPAIDVRSFPEAPDTEFFKFVDDETLQHHRNGSVQIGSIQYYRDIEKRDSKDPREGLANLIVATPKKRIFTSLVSGLNYGIFCGTHHLSNKEKMHARFGQHILRIKDTRKFADFVADCFGARGYYVHRVKYADLKLFRTNTLRRFDLADDSSGKPTIDEKLFEFLRSKSFFASVFMKPRRFDDESELRIAFEFSKDLPTFERRRDRALLNHIEVIS